MNIRNLFVGVFAVASLALAGCGGGFSCSDKGKCSNDVAPTQTAIDACNKAINDSACGSKAKDVASCAESNATCDANGNSTTDLSKCATQTSALLSCCQSNPTSAACGG
ncbi:MAG: hypothetical protein JST54_16195 [Deltaproteobacteria bacterium]|nr:hypothetical protein [Deltaproteobacteria bacterium]